MNEIQIKVLSRINKLLDSNEFDFSIEFLSYIHKYLFNGLEKDIYKNITGINDINNLASGQIRTFNLHKKEKILNGETVLYANYYDILPYLEYDFNDEKKKKYKSIEDILKNIPSFNSRVWQTHPFIDGNTRTISIFINKYLRSLGYFADNEIFKDNNEYYRNALVLANYYNNDISPDNTYLNLFYQKLLLDREISLDKNSQYVRRLFSNNNTIRK